MSYNFPTIANGGSIFNSVNQVENRATTFMGRVTRAFQGTSSAIAYNSANMATKPTIEEKQVMIEEVHELKKVDAASKDVSRHVLSFPSQDAVNECNAYYHNFSRKVEHYKMNEHDLNHILEAVPDARSSIGWKQNPDASRRLAKQKQFLEDVKTTPNYCENNFATASADRESIDTGLGYRAINAPWVAATTQPTDGMNRMTSDIRSNGYLVAPIGKEFKERYSEDMKNNSTADKGVYIGQELQDEIPGVCGQMPGLPERVFTENSYVAEGINQGVPMRAHTSGSMPLTLGMDEFMMNEVNTKPQADPDAIRQTGGVFTALYDIGDYHTIAESTAGVEHRIQELTDVRITDETRPTLNNVNPSTFLYLGIGNMNRVVDEAKLPEFNNKVHTLLENVQTAKQERQQKLKALEE